MEVKSVCEIVRQAETSDKNGITTSSKFVSSSLREDVDRTEAYLNSKHISGDTDYMGRPKPFFNIVMAARNIWYRATDIDRKDIKVRASSQDTELEAFLATILLQAWMKKQAFGQFLNDWGLCLATHGSAITKFIEKDGALTCRVMDWNNMLIDQVDFDANVKIEKLWFTPAQLKQQKGYDQDLVDKLLDSTTTRKTLGGQKKDNKADYIAVYEVHGELPLSLLTDNEKDDERDDDTFVQQVHIVTFQQTKDNSDGFDDYTLYAGKEAKDPYLITHLIKKDGQTYSGGAVKNLFEAQWMINHTQKQILDQLDLASKIVFQTSDGSFAGQNALSNIENGDILNHKLNEPLTMLNNKPDIVAMQSFQASWQQVSNQINGISEAMAGENAPSGTAWRQVQALLQESHSLFELMTENKGLSLIEMLTSHIIPYFKKQLNNSDEISSILEDYQIKQIDARYVPNEAMRRVNNKIKDTILSGRIYDPNNQALDVASATAEIQSNLKGSQRFISPSEISSKTWKEILKDLEWDLELDVTNELKDVQGALSTLSTALQTVASNPALLTDPNAKLVFNRILSLTGSISPVEIQTVQAQPTAQPMVGAPVPQPA